MDKGCLEIGNINTPASAGVIRKLKSILDQHGIFHIIDGVMFNQPHKNAARRKAVHRGWVRECNYSQDDSHRDKKLPVDLEKYQELIVPDLYKLNYMSIANFDAEDADFLATLVYGEN